MDCLVGSRSGDRIDAFSAPTSPMGPPPSGGYSSRAADGGDGGQQEAASGNNGQSQQQQQQTAILRNPLRGSKCKLFGDFVRNCLPLFISP